MTDELEMVWKKAVMA